MVATVDAMIGYITYPHVDAEERGMEAGRAMKEMIGGMRTAKAHIRLPLVPPLVTQVRKGGAGGPPPPPARSFRCD